MSTAGRHWTHDEHANLRYALCLVDTVRPYLLSTPPPVVLVRIPEPLSDAETGRGRSVLSLLVLLLFSNCASERHKAQGFSPDASARRVSLRARSRSTASRCVGVSKPNRYGCAYTDTCPDATPLARGPGAQHAPAPRPPVDQRPQGRLVFGRHVHAPQPQGEAGHVRGRRRRRATNVNTSSYPSRCYSMGGTPDPSRRPCIDLAFSSVTTMN